MSGPITKTATAALVHAAEEASRRGDRRIGTDHLLLGLLHDPAASRALSADLTHARATAERLDRIALSAIGLELEPSASVDATRRAGSAPPTSGLRSVIARAVALARAEGARKAEPQHLLRALLECHHPDPAAVLLDAMKQQPPMSTEPR